MPSHKRNGDRGVKKLDAGKAKKVKTAISRLPPSKPKGKKWVLDDELSKWDIGDPENFYDHQLVCQLFDREVCAKKELEEQLERFSLTEQSTQTRKPRRTGRGYRLRGVSHTKEVAKLLVEFHEMSTEERKERVVSLLQQHNALKLEMAMEKVASMRWVFDAPGFGDTYPISNAIARNKHEEAATWEVEKKLAEMNDLTNKLSKILSLDNSESQT